jgi:predicted TPR repeat methyltransferase
MVSFDAKAATWDDEPRRRALAQAIVAAIRRHAPARPDQRTLDLGCGTGLVGLPLVADGGSLRGIDLAPAMIARVLAKAQAAGLDRVEAEVRDLVSSPLPAASVDLAVSAMAFHHLADPPAMLASLAGCLAPGGLLAVADLESEDGSFHDEPVPHRGFDPAAFAALMVAAGLEAVACERVHLLEKSGRSYPVFLAVARRPA